MTIRKAVIPVAGLGTRFLPATKTVPKELLPIIDRPTIEYIVDEAVSSGIEEICFITNRDKKSLIDYFDRHPQLEDHLRQKNKSVELKAITRMTDIVKITAIRQQIPHGLGDAILLAESFAAGEPIAVLLGDDVIAGEPPALSALINHFHRYGKTVIGVQKVDKNKVHKYGIIDPHNIDQENLLLNGIIEKPNTMDAPSNLAALGRYILTPDIFALLKTQSPGKNDEIQLTDALNRLAQENNVYACVMPGKRYDLGDKLGFLQANIDFALKRKDLNNEFREWLVDRVKSI